MARLKPSLQTANAAEGPPVESLPLFAPSRRQTLSLLFSAEGVRGAGVLRQLGNAQNVKS